MRARKLFARSAFEFRRAFRAFWGTALVLGVVALLWRGWFFDLRQPGADYARGVAAALLAGALAIKVAARVLTGERRRSPRREMLSDIELGLLLLAAAYVFLSVLGGTTSSIYPLIYALVSFLVTFHPLKTGAPLAAAALGFEAVMAFGPGAAPGAAASFPAHAGFIGVFAVLNVAFLHAEVARQRREHRKRLEAEVQSMREEARDFRLISPALAAESRLRTRAEEEEKLSQGSIETIHQQLLHAIELLRHALGLKTCALLWLDGTGEKLKLKELSTTAQNITEGALPARAGVFAAVLKEGRSCVLESPRPALLPYYRGPEEVAAFVGVPVFEGKTLRGLLIGDRAKGPAFTPSESQLFVSAASQIMRIVQSERVFQAVERSKHEHERFYRASTALNRALTLEEVYAAALEGARGVCDFDFAAIAAFDERTGRHTVSMAVGEGSEGLLGTQHRDPASIASMVVKNKLALPANGEWRERHETHIFDGRDRVRGFESLYVLPLLVKDEVLGTFAIAARRPGAFSSDRREMLGVVANQVAISMQNGRMVQSLEEQATTDGLTGLLNHRTFQERLQVMLGRADRHNFRVAVLLTDIDHFKKVNDTYGHPTGDAVLRRVAGILKASARKIDIVARYGGEEFALVLEGTDRAGARQLAERIREEVALQTFESGQGVFTATLSLGVAVYPDDGRAKQDVIACADKALYAAKHGGRNRTVCHGETSREAPSLRAAVG
ncbi:MAG: diguanylate cyclase [Deltaproteobacteria bacterium]|nr:diguanylate cyclase [Deltaproteobacteria bacterium]